VDWDCDRYSSKAEAANKADITRLKSARLNLPFLQYHEWDTLAVSVLRLVFDLALVGFGVFQFVPRRENLGLAGEVQIANGAGELVR